MIRFKSFLPVGIIAALALALTLPLAPFTAMSVSADNTVNGTPASNPKGTVTITAQAPSSNPPSTDTITVKNGGNTVATQKVSLDSSSNTYKYVYTYNHPVNMATQTLQACDTASGGSCQSFTIPTDSSATITSSDSGQGGGSGINSPQCEDSGYPLSWAFCKIIEGLSDGVDWIFTTLIQPLLQLQPVDVQGSVNDPSHTYQIWSNFRIYGDIFLVIALLVIVFGESIGGGMIDAYSVKKILPRLLIAAVLINLSIYLIALAVDITNIVGDGINNLLQAPFQAQIKSGHYYVLQMHFNKALDATVTALTVAYIVKKLFSDPTTLKSIGSTGFDGLMYLLIIVLIPAFFIFLAIMATVILRRGLILFLLFIAPVAFALYCLPNTEKYFRQWWDTLFKTLLIYPIIAVMFALGNILSVVISSSTGGIAGAMATFIGVICMLAPLVLIPYSFRIAGGLIGRFHELATQAATRGHQAVHGNDQDPDSMKNRARRRFAMSRNEANLTGKAFTNRLARPQDLLSAEGRARRAGRLAGVREAQRGKLDGQFSEADVMFQHNKNNDQYLVALTDEEFAKREQEAARRKGDMTAVAAWTQAIDSARATPHTQATQMAALQQLATTGFQFDAGQDGYNQLAERVAKAVGVSENELQRDASGNITGATGRNAGAFANAMNQAQYSLRNAGRYDLGGINNGQGFDAKEGLNKASLFELANGKPKSIQTMIESLPAGPATHAHAVAYKELEAMLPNSKGAVRDEITKQMKVLETLPGTNVIDYMKQADPSKKPVSTRVQYDSNSPGAASWNSEERLRGWRMEMHTPTRGEAATRDARSYERPDPNRL